MNDTFSLTLQQMDVINLSLDKARAIAQMVAECGGKRKPGEDEPTPASLFVVMQVVVEELQQIAVVMQVVNREDAEQG